jgi:hypothetical protein
VETAPAWTVQHLAGFPQECNPPSGACNLEIWNLYKISLNGDVF